MQNLEYPEIIYFGEKDQQMAEIYLGEMVEVGLK